MKTAIYVKMDAPEDLLLSEGVCRQLGILTYHPEVQPLRAKRSEQTDEKAMGSEMPELQAGCQVPMVRVRLVKGLWILPNQSTLAEVELCSQEFRDTHRPMLFEPDGSLQGEYNVHVEDGLLQINEGKTAMLSVVNHLGFTQELEKGAEVGGVTPVELVDDAIPEGMANCLSVTQESEKSIGYEGVGPNKVVDATVAVVHSPHETQEDEEIKGTRGHRNKS